jgi:hypothetical protein
MKTLLAAVAVLALTACGRDEASKPAPVTPTPQVIPEVKPEAKAPEAPKADPNKELAGRVKRALEGAKLYGIDPSASDGKVTLWGTTATDGERKQAGGIATKVEGVSTVDNQIKVVKGS